MLSVKAEWQLSSWSEGRDCLTLVDSAESLVAG